ncbi:MAG: cyclic nucleotide-binding domain-containing protein [Rhodospirillaceae bacterium]|jgi:CRP/FNR family transcriptional regulator, cyclic AMP receptor protein|nr:cyclic nucleotide-binding domain-containing protein [Rhodospirillaceae bacterium]MBT5241596.1 cyclic nucleotide-binding domain-containing protein [Rhodospirillaceae bacterium]MBT5567365.1 cyclic nucleotide-binding domain-containing protein [Rhodospirillaceae bacterium]MBT6089695.1 cyclic nucleotide-binding domain-containing protein [Rhodospirillaceae bacterium]MBT7449216.1 cyclic nucleotide-binding domain-containing protein [Rhodospirillaceae bacterium]
MPSNSEDFSVKAVTKVLDRKVFPAQKPVFLEGDVGMVAYILMRGDVTIYGGFGTPNQKLLMKMSTGQMFGELALMANAKRTATAFTETGCELLSISQAKLSAKLDGADPFVRYWIEYLSKRVIDLTTKKDFG